ncbi:MAG: TolC family outer membrane protein [Pseudomonadota bacterium]
MRRVTWTLGVCALVFAGAQASAETLADTLVSAYNNSNLLDQNRAVLRAADEDVAVTVAALRPIVQYSASRQTTWDLDTEVTTDVFGFQSRANSQSIINTLELTASWSIYAFGRNRLSVEAAKQAVLATRESLASQEQSVLFAAVQAFTEVRRAQSFVDLRRNNVRVLQEEVRAARDRLAVGDVTRTDVAQAEARLAEAEANLEAAQGDLTEARESYRLAVGRYPGNLEAPPPFPATAQTLDAARAIALVQHPEIRAAQFNVKTQEVNVEIAKRAALPSLSASGAIGYSDQRSIDDDLEPQASLGLGITGPIYSGGSINAQYRRAIAVLDQNKSNLLQTTLNIEERLGFAWSQLRVAQARLVATARQIEANQIAFEGTKEEQTLGERTTLDVLNAEQELLDSQGDRIDALRIEQDAFYFLLSTMGLLTASNLGLDVLTYDPEAYYDAVRTAPPGITSQQGEQIDRVLQAIGRQ